MRVEHVAIFDTEFEVSTLVDTIRNGASEMKVDLAEVTSVSAICNAANFELSLTSTDSKRSIVGDATGRAMSSNIARLL